MAPSPPGPPLPSGPRQELAVLRGPWERPPRSLRLVARTVTAELRAWAEGGGAAQDRAGSSAGRGAARRDFLLRASPGTDVRRWPGNRGSARTSRGRPPQTSGARRWGPAPRQRRGGGRPTQRHLGTINLIFKNAPGASSCPAASGEGRALLSARCRLPAPAPRCPSPNVADGRTGRGAGDHHPPTSALHQPPGDSPRRSRWRRLLPLRGSGAIKCSLRVRGLRAARAPTPSHAPELTASTESC